MSINLSLVGWEWVRWKAIVLWQIVLVFADRPFIIILSIAPCHHKICATSPAMSVPLSPSHLSPFFERVKPPMAAYEPPGKRNRCCFQLICLTGHQVKGVSCTSIAKFIFNSTFFIWCRLSVRIDFETNSAEYWLNCNHVHVKPAERDRPITNTYFNFFRLVQHKRQSVRPVQVTFVAILLLIFNLWRPSRTTWTLLLRPENVQQRCWVSLTDVQYFSKQFLA